MIKLGARKNSLTEIGADVVALFVLEDKKIFSRQMKKLVGDVKGIAVQIAASTFDGKERQTLLLYPDKSAAKRLMLVGLGKSEKMSLERLRRGAAATAKQAQKQKSKSLALLAPDPAVVAPLISASGAPSWHDIGTALGEGIALGVYKYSDYISKSERDDDRLNTAVLVSDDEQIVRALRAGLNLAQIVSEATYSARDLENAPGNEIYPDSLARYSARVGRKYGFNVRVLDERKIKNLRMGGLLGVSQGSDKPPRFIIMEHNAKDRYLPTVVLVGKGVTFDSGGISIKPSANMAEMKMDMSGAAAVIGIMQAAARLKLPQHIVGLVPATENLLGGSSLKPGDILRHFNGKTSEVDNTDAEGRLILADALSFASKYKPHVVIDLATLTGACVVALGHVATGMMGNDQKTMDLLRESGDRTYERVWQLPMFDEYEKLIKSDIADVKNTGGRWAGAITAGMFLGKFIGNYKWVHLDIAGTAIIEEPSDYIPKGGSGVGVRLLIDFLRHWKGRQANGFGPLRQE